MIIHLALSPSFERYSPATVEQDGIGGSEHMAIELSRELARQGHLVVVYAECFEGYYGEPGARVEWRDLTRPLAPCDVFISSRLPNKYNPQAPVNLFWAHDIHYGDEAAPLLERFDARVTLSTWHKEVWDARYPNAPSTIIRNGLPEWMVELAERHFSDLARKPWYFYASSPDRGLEKAITEFERVVARHIANGRLGGDSPRLHVMYGFLTLKARAENRRDQKLLEQIARWEELVRGTIGVVYHDRLSRRESFELMLQCRGWIYPTEWEETSCLVAMEAMLAGCRVFSPLGPDGQRVGALRDTLDGVPDELGIATPSRHNHELALKRFRLRERAEEWTRLGLSFLSD